MDASDVLLEGRGSATFGGHHRLNLLEPLLQFSLLLELLLAIVRLWRRLALATVVLVQLGPRVSHEAYCGESDSTSAG